MTRSTRLRTAIAALAALSVLAFAVAALAAQPIKGSTYAGTTAHAKVSVELIVSKNGKTLKASVPAAPLYCQGGGPPVTQVTKPAKISAKGSFSGNIGYVYRGKVAYKLHFSGRFVKRKLATGTVRSEYVAKQCNGSTSFTAVPAGAR